VEPLNLRDWNDIADTDVVFFERPGQLHFEPSFNLIKDYGLKLWLDFDDDLFSVPIKPFNPSGNHFNDPKVQKVIQKYLSMADVVTVSTEAIKDAYKEYCDPIIIPNAFNDYNYDWTYRRSTAKGIMWRGSIFHRFNLKIAKQAILAAEKNFPEWRWKFIGEAAGDIWSEMKNADLFFDTATVKYMKMLPEMNCSIQVFPLVDDKFNRAKSNCSWVEGTWAGAVMLAPDFPEYRRPGITNYTDMPDFYQKLLHLITEDGTRKKNFDDSFKFIKENYLLSHVNDQRVEILKGLL
jgi:hypothetical protein